MILLSKSKIAATFHPYRHSVLRRKKVNQLITENVQSWQIDEPPQEDSAILVESPSQTDVLNALVKDTELESIRLAFPYRTVFRFSWGKAPTYQILQSLDDNGYFSHYTAIQMHGLTDQLPKTVYFNVEQPATGGGGALSQEAIDRAFRGKCRVSNNVIDFRDLTVRKLNGQNTGQLGVIEFEQDEGFSIRLTNIERTLIDAAVRPVYAGGVGEVAQAYKNAAGNVSVNKMVAYLRKLNYTYPYHQSIGFYLEHSGKYKASQISLLRKFPIENDFYLTYKLKNPQYNERWRLYIPKGF